MTRLLLSAGFDPSVFGDFTVTVKGKNKNRGGLEREQSLVSPPLASCYRLRRGWDRVYKEVKRAS